MNRELIDADPLSPSFFRIACNYITTKHKLKLCAPKFPIYNHGDFIFLGGKELIDPYAAGSFGDSTMHTSKSTWDNSIEVYLKREWMINWCEKKMKSGTG